MVRRVQRVDQEYRVVLSEEAMQQLHLTEGAEVQLLPVEAAAPIMQFLSTEEVVQAYRATLPSYRADYEELAK